MSEIHFERNCILQEECPYKINSTCKSAHNIFFLKKEKEGQEEKKKGKGVGGVGRGWEGEGRGRTFIESGLPLISSE